MKIRVADYIANFLVENNITDVFTVTGGGAMYLNDALGHHSKIHCTYNHHEQASAIAAEAYARFSNQIAAVCVTSGPGGTNALTGVLGGWLDSIPMFIISGQVKFSTTIKSTDIPLRQLGDQEFNIVDCVKTMTKYAVMITDENLIAYHLEKALFIAKQGRPGPVWLDIPLNIQGTIVETGNLKHFSAEEEQIEGLAPTMKKKQVEDVLYKIVQAKKPVIFVGSGIRLANVHEQFITLIEKLNIPVVTAWNAHDVLWDEHKLYCGRPGTIGNRGGNFVVQNSDLLLVLGSRLNIRQISYNWENFAKNAYKIVVDVDVAELQKPTIKSDMPIQANLKDFIDLFLKVIPQNYTSHTAQWLKWCKNINEKYPVVQSEYYKKNTPINPYVFMDELFKHLVEEDTIITSNGSACVCSFQAATIKKGQRLFTNSGCASMGYGLPAALGVAVYQKNQRVICLEGDGSIQMNLQELQTILHNKLKLKIFWLNNNGYHSIRQTQTNLFSLPLCGVCEDNGISFPFAEKIAFAYNIPYTKIDKVDTLAEKIKNILFTDKLELIEVVLDTTQNFEPKLSAKRLLDGTMISPSLEDMFPFLPADEMNENIYTSN